jgi:hypothetical protein
MIAMIGSALTHLPHVIYLLRLRRPLFTLSGALSLHFSGGDESAMNQWAHPYSPECVE